MPKLLLMLALAAAPSIRAAPSTAAVAIAAQTDPAKLNRFKSASIGEQQKVFVKELHEAKLLSDACLIRT